MLIPIDPVILALGPFAVRWFGALALLGLGLAVWLSLRDLHHLGLSRKRALDALAWGLPAGILVARLVNVLGWWDAYLTHPAELWQLNLDGLSLWGGLLGGAAFSRRAPASAHRPAAAAAHPRRDCAQRGARDCRWPARRVSGRARAGAGVEPAVGDRVCEPAGGHARLRRPAPARPGVRRPGGAGAVRGVAQFCRGRWPAGTRVASFLIAYGAARVLLGSVRLDPAFLFGLQIEQILALGAIIFGVWYGLRPMVSARRARRLSPAATGRAQPAEDSLAA